MYKVFMIYNYDQLASDISKVNKENGIINFATKEYVIYEVPENHGE